MLDHLSINIPFSYDYLIMSNDGKYMKVNADLFDFDLKLASRAVYKGDDGLVRAGALYHPYESIPTHFTGLALKVFIENNGFECQPYVNIKASPAKLLQGHNVYGSDDIESGFMEMLGYLATAYPDLYKMLDMPKAKLSHLDVTYSARAESEEQAKEVLDYLRNVSNGHTKQTKSRNVYDTTVYWGGATSRLINIKCYLKHEEFKVQYQEMYNKAQANDKSAQRVLAVMQNDELWDFTVGLIRLEARLKSRWLERKGIPTNMLDLIKFQREQPHILTSLWTSATLSLMNALRGQKVQYYDDEAVLKKISSSPIVLNHKGK